MTQCATLVKCAICIRQVRGFGWFDTREALFTPQRHKSYRKFCSIHCQDIYASQRRGRIMIDPTPLERAARLEAFRRTGARHEGPRLASGGIDTLEAGGAILELPVDQLLEPPHAAHRKAGRTWSMKRCSEAFLRSVGIIESIHRLNSS